MCGVWETAWCSIFYQFLVQCNCSKLYSNIGNQKRKLFESEQRFLVLIFIFRRSRDASCRENALIRTRAQILALTPSSTDWNHESLTHLGGPFDSHWAARKTKLRSWSMYSQTSISEHCRSVTLRLSNRASESSKRTHRRCFRMAAVLLVAVRRQA